MCIVSNVTDWGMRTWPSPDIYPKPYRPSQPWETTPVVPHDGPTRREWEDFKEMIQKALELDKYTKQPDCIDPKKEAWLKKMEEIYDAKST